LQSCGPYNAKAMPIYLYFKHPYKVLPGEQ